ncbi:cytochrome ubiquinol oxidase subunit I [Candidatus Cyrtobacter comes]|nr:cytochrome ubiquinol oxidase subunit I [Candidatus Cyrtobacter comes]
MLSRIQFAANITFHILFPTFTISLAWFLLFFKLKYNSTNDQRWLDAYKFWVKIFALSFALGVVSGITMSFQFGTNWPGFMEKVGNVAGPLLGYEVLTAFFMEATFLGIMLFGTNRVSNWLHNLSIVLVALGTMLSAFWILALNSWMHTPAGYEIIEGVVHPKNWFEIVFNPSMLARFTHMILASFVTSSFLVAGICAYKYLKGDRSDMISLKFSMYVAAILVPVHIFSGDILGLNLLDHRPQVVAAIEGIWETESSVPFLLFAIPDEKERKNHFEVKLPKMGSLLLTHSWDGEIKGLNEFEGEHPPVMMIFYLFRVMVGIGFLMLAVSWFASYKLWRENKITNKFFNIILVAMTFSGSIATISGWYVTEVGRQPYLVNGILRTKDAVTQAVGGGAVFSTLVGYLVVYVLLIALYISTIFYMAKRRALESIAKYGRDGNSNTGKRNQG